MADWLPFALVAVVVAVTAFVGLYRPPTVEDSTDDEPSPPDGVTRFMAGGLPGAERDVTVIGPELRQAGLYQPDALITYRAVRAGLVIFPLLAAFVLALVVPQDRIGRVLLIGFGLAVLGYAIPRLYIGWKARQRRQQIENGLPVAMDLVSLGLLAGQTVNASFGRAAREMARPYPALAEEMLIVRRQSEISSLSNAVTAWADRSGVADVRTLAVVLNQAERLGTDTASGLNEFASNLRLSLRQRAEARANRATFWMLFPTILCLWLPAAAILIGPVVYEFGNRLSKARETREELQDNPTVQRLRDRLGPIVGGAKK